MSVRKIKGEREKVWFEVEQVQNTYLPAPPEKKKLSGQEEGKKWWQVIP